jgi:hypothetical protein
VIVFERWPERHAALATQIDFDPSDVNQLAPDVQALINAIRPPGQASQPSHPRAG